MAFLRNLLAAILGFFIATGLIFLFFLLIATAAASTDENIVLVKHNSILEIDLDLPLSDYGGEYSYVDLEFLNYENYTGLYHILDAIEYAKTDDDITGISIKNSTFIQGGFANIKAIRDAIEDFKASGKFVYSYSDGYSQKDYYLASVADSVFLTPVGDLELKGLSSEILFYKDLQDKTGIKLEVIRHGEYKSAVEPFLQNEMSPANREQITELLSSIWKTIATDMANSRGIDFAQFNTITDELGARTAELAVANHIIDKAFYLDQYEELLKDASGLPAFEELRTVNIYEYAEHISKKLFIGQKPNKIAVIFAQGEIQYAEGSNQIIGQDVMIKALREARENDDVQGIVLRVNSPGGSALASDIIWREVQVTQSVKPVYVSMGNYAASGGYYISCGAEKIFAEPNTITGSIGVFGLLPNIKELANNWGINSQQVGTNKSSNGYSIFQGLTEEKRTEIQESIENFYKTFVNKVAKGRNMTFEEVDAVARGRVWSGTDALDKGLVDELGGLNATIEALANDKDITEYSIETYPKYENITSLETLLGRFASSSTLAEEQLEKELGTETYTILKKLNELNQLKGIQARLPYELDIK
ncbi:signal peptide peptidase SppA [Neptunitalea lumnitzerae]|uniref:Signal peptide peptidase SppA n=1 Tax=Neptunitalea lumnitzerae TaxID=2965509 RepID=A0ABQ5MJ74_9FLAO|nr:signal peptide peptidase SppA [Neptunitalea sp. Y10]GLB48987.1 signal peptide peptidase SppA [Neptunitalea sp. Y10]